MAKEITLWETFFKALHKQPKVRLDEWLAKWCFGDEGASLIDIFDDARNDVRGKLEKAIAELCILYSVRDLTIH